MSARYLEPTDPELVRAWRTFPDPVMACEGEVLEYMGSEPDPQAGYVHVFRHRCYPVAGVRHYWRIAASRGWSQHAAALAPGYAEEA
jgi:hypothetical protein